MALPSLETVIALNSILFKCGESYFSRISHPFIFCCSSYIMMMYKVSQSGTWVKVQVSYHKMTLIKVKVSSKTIT